MPYFVIVLMTSFYLHIPKYVVLTGKVDSKIDFFFGTLFNFVCESTLKQLTFQKYLAVSPDNTEFI